MGQVLLILTRSGHMTGKDKPKGEWGSMSLHVDGKFVKTFDALERRGGYVFLPKGEYLAKKHFAPKIGGLSYYKKYMKDPKFNSLWPQVVSGDGGTPDDTSDDTYAPLSGKRGNILIHAANNAGQLAGCMAPGTIVNTTTLGQSIQAMSEILLAMGDTELARLQVLHDPTDK